MSEFVTDLGSHAGRKCTQAINDAMNLVDDPADMAKIALMALGHVAGFTGGAFAVSRGGGRSQEDQTKFTCAVLDIVKDTVSKGAERAYEDWQKRGEPAR